MDASILKCRESAWRLRKSLASRRLAVHDLARRAGGRIENGPARYSREAVMKLIRKILRQTSDEVGGNAVSPVICARDLKQFLFGKGKELPTLIGIVYCLAIDLM